MVASGGLVGWGQSRCRARFTCHLTYLRLMTRGLLRCLELPGFRGHLILGETLEEGGPDGSSSEVPRRVPS
jgi:hypothetical protein